MWGIVAYLAVLVGAARMAGRARRARMKVFMMSVDVEFCRNEADIKLRCEKTSVDAVKPDFYCRHLVFVSLLISSPLHFYKCPIYPHVCSTEEYLQLREPSTVVCMSCMVDPFPACKQARPILPRE
jgi:hypothetical protein